MTPTMKSDTARNVLPQTDDLATIAYSFPLSHPQAVIPRIVRFLTACVR